MKNKWKGAKGIGKRDASSSSGTQSSDTKLDGYAGLRRGRMPCYHGLPRLVAHLDVDHEYHGGKLGERRVESFKSGVSWTIPYFKWDDRTGSGGLSRLRSKAAREVRTRKCA